jgi:hypothetical protein
VGDQHVTITIRFQLQQLNFDFYAVPIYECCVCCDKNTCICGHTCIKVALVCNAARRKLTAVFLGFYCVRQNVLCKFTAERIKANLQLRVMELAAAVLFQLKRSCRRFFMICIQLAAVFCSLYVRQSSLDICIFDVCAACTSIGVKLIQ